MPTIHQLPNHSPFLQSALANVESANWYTWDKGICVGYQDNSDVEHAILCWWQEEDVAFLLKVPRITKVSVASDAIVILTDTEWILWNGRQSLHCQVSPMNSWKKVQVTSWGGIGFTQMGYYKWYASSGQVERMPMGVEKVWGLSQFGDILWSEWGQFFYYSQGCIVPIEAISDKMEKWFLLQNGWCVALFDMELIAVHPKFPTKRFWNADILDVIGCGDSKRLKILLADGCLLQWEPSREPSPVEQDEVDGDFFLAEDWLFYDGKLEFCGIS